MNFYITEMLSMEQEAILAKNSSDIVRRLMSVTESKGLRNSDLSSLTGWNASKISKLINNKQKLSPEDLKTWAMCLGYTPDVFLDENLDIRKFDLSDSVRNLLKCLDDIITYRGGLSAEVAVGDIVRYEFPLSIISILQVEPSDYIIQGAVNHGLTLTNPFDKDIKKNLDDGVTIKLRHRNVQLIDNLEITLECSLSPDRNKMIIGVYLFTRNGSLNRLDRAQSKDLLLVDEKRTKVFDDYAQGNQDWIPRYMVEGEIFSLLYNTFQLPDESELENDFRIVFDKFCDLVYAKSNGVDIKGRNKMLSPSDVLRIFTGENGFSTETIKKILKSRNYQCENNPEHKSFMNDEGNQYMDVIPLIPLEQELVFGQGIQSEANGLCLCPLCSAQYKHGKKKDRAQMVFSLFTQHEEALKNNGIDIAISQVLALNEL